MHGLIIAMPFWAARRRRRSSAIVAAPAGNLLGGARGGVAFAASGFELVGLSVSTAKRQAANEVLDPH